CLGYKAYSFISGSLIENPRTLVSEGQDRSDRLSTAIDNLFLIMGGHGRRVVFVKAEGKATPSYALTRAVNGESDTHKSLTFCVECPHPHYCGMNFNCGLSGVGAPPKPRHLDPPPGAAAPAAPLGLQSLFDAQQCGQVWLND